MSYFFELQNNGDMSITAINIDCIASVQILPKPADETENPDFSMLAFELIGGQSITFIAESEDHARSHFKALMQKIRSSLR